jgi:2-iminobutanoate/2-iminopropanoate deaminase
MSVERILHQGAPTPRGPYSSCVKAGDFVFVSALGPADEHDKYSAEGIQNQTRQVIVNLQKILADAGCTLHDVVQVSVFLRDISQFHAMNEIYAEFFDAIKPARTTVEAKFVQPVMLVGMDCVAYKARA